MSTRGKDTVNSVYDWQTPATLIEYTNNLRLSLGKRTLFREGVAFREAYIAGKFAKHIDSDSVRLLRPGAQPTPDFALRIGHNELWFESTEADRPSRKRNLEYSQPNSFESIRSLRDDEWVDQSDYSKEIDRLCRQKSLKCYDKCDGLIINSNAFGIIDENLMDEAWWRQTAQAAHPRFEQVWRYHQSAFARIY